MGNACSSSAALDAITRRLGGSLGQLHVTGRYHKPPAELTDRYDIGDVELGAGFAGTVLQATRVDGSPGVYAVKTLKLDRFGCSKEKLEEIEGEVEVALSMDHPNIVRLLDVYEDTKKRRLQLVMECLKGGELLNRIQDKKRLDEQEAACLFQQMLRAVRYLHCHDVVHRDLKPENFMFDKEGGSHLRLIDFGFAKHTQSSQNLHEALGTLSYAAPEVLAGNYNKECDLWSLGVMLFVMLAGTMPFFGHTQAKTKQAIASGDFNMKPTVWNSISPDAADLVRKLLVVQPRKRLTALQALHHPFVTQNNQAPQLSVDHVQVVDAFRKFGKSSKFQRAAILMCAHTLTNDERRSFREVFIELDTDNSGTISIEELQSLMVNEQHMSEAESRQTFEAMDFNGDGELHYIDFLAAVACFTHPIKLDDKHMRDAFDRFDVDRTGYISRKNLESVLGESSSGDVKSFIAEADENGDGKISFHEFAVLVNAAPHISPQGETDSDDEQSYDEEDDESGRCHSCALQ